MSRVALLVAASAALAAVVLLPGAWTVHLAILAFLGLAAWAALRGARLLGCAGVALAALAAALGTRPDASLAALAGGAALALACWVLASILLPSAPPTPRERALGAAVLVVGLASAALLAELPVARALLDGPFAAPALTLFLGAVGTLTMAAAAAPRGVRSVHMEEQA